LYFKIANKEFASKCHAPGVCDSNAGFVGEMLDLDMAGSRKVGKKIILIKR